MEVRKRSNFRIPGLVYIVKDSISHKIDVEIEPTVKWKPKLISYMLMIMKSLTFFSLGAAHASQVYTKTVNRGFFSAALTPYKPTQNSF